MENLLKKNMAFFMSSSGSLRSWDKNGTLARETNAYCRLAKEFGHIYIFSYGDKRDLDCAGFLEKNMSVITRPSAMPPSVYEFFLPFWHWKSIKNCHILKTNQNSGAIAPAIAKIIFPKKKLVVRSGYIGSEFARRSKLSYLARLYFFIAENLSYQVCDRAFIPKGDAGTLLKKYSFLKDRLVIMNNAINTTLFKKLDAERKYDIVYQARLDPVQKNHQGLLEAIEGLGLRLLLIGKGEAKKEILAEAQKRKIDLTLLDRVPNEDLPKIYNSAKMCVFPSFFEGNPKALLECMSCELPIAACDVTGVNNLILHEKTGLLSKTDGQSIRKNILRLMENTELGARLGQNARQFIIENYSFEKLLRKEIEIYKKLITLHH